MTKKYLGYTNEKLETLGGADTAREIAGQPELWQKTWQKVASEKEELQKFVDSALSLTRLNIVLTGAGTSAFIGEVAEPMLNRYWPRLVRALSTTTLVTHFEEYIETDHPLLLISFARSGNSPESTATVRLAEEYSEEQVFHLVITCNPEGDLAKQTADLQSYRFLMPPEAEDQSLAMTGSFSSMLLAVLLMGRLDELPALEKAVQQLAERGRALLNEHVESLKKFAELDFNRAVFLGSGPRLGIARESHLKLQELTDGHVVCKYDSFLGFRHGPKAVIDDHTVIVYLFSEDPHVLRYEKDLVQNIYDKGFGLATMGIGMESSANRKIDLEINLGSVNRELPEVELLPILSVLPAQVLGFFSSLEHGVQPDTPSASGAISRVVEGVTIYPLEHHH